MDLQPDISICIVTRDNFEHIRKMLQSLYQTADPVIVETIIIDNASSRPFASELDKEFPHIKIIENNKPEPAVKVKNMAIHLARGRYISFWDDSIVFVKNCLKNILLFLDENPETGIAAPKIIDDQNLIEPSARKLPSLLYLLAKTLCLNSLWPKNPLFKKHLIYDWDRLSPLEVDWLFGTALIIRREVVNEIGHFDEGFRLFYEDADYCRRARRAGWHIFFRTDAAIQHNNPKRYSPTNPFDPPPPGSPPSNADKWYQICDSFRFLRRKWFAATSV